MPVTLRPARLDDAPLLDALAVRFYDHQPPWRTEREIVEGTRRALRDGLAARTERALLAIAERDGQGVGFVYAVEHDDFFTGEPHAHISEIAVVEDGTGAGRALMDAAETWARERGVRYISLNVVERNTRARALYERLGYTIEYRHMTKLLA